MSHDSSTTVRNLVIYRPSTAGALVTAVDDFLRAHVRPSSNSQDDEPTMAQLAAKCCAMLFAPNWFSFAKVARDSGQSTLLTPDSVPIDQAYEARVFNKYAELRWYRPQGEALGTSVWLADSPLPGAGAVPAETVGCVCTLVQSYLLWGRGIQADGLPDSNWSWLAEHRTKRLAVPLKGVSRTDRGQLCATEYLRADEWGNVSVVNERFTGLQIHPIKN